MKRRTVFLYWLLFLVPTIAISIAAAKLLINEGQRLRDQAKASAADRLTVIADNLKNTVSAVEDNLSLALRRLPDDPAALQAWQAENPLVRNIFIWTPGTGLKYPAVKQGATRDEIAFVARYDALFAGRVPWTATALDPLPDPKTRNSSSFSFRGARSTRQELVDLARSSSPGATTEEKSGWIPWFSENQLYLLGWTQASTNGPIRGIELEFMTLLSRLVAAFPDNPPPGQTYAIIDGAGKIIHQCGTPQPPEQLRHEIEIPLAPQLPHWSVAIFCPGGIIPSQSHGAFLTLSFILLGIFVAAIILGGSLLTWQAHLNMRDATQKTSFVSNVSHELKTPLTSIRMYAELLSQNRVRDEAKKKQYLDIISAESQRLTRLVNNVLDFGRLEEGKKKYLLEDLDLTAFLAQFAETNRLRISDAGLSLQLNIPDMIITAHSDRDAVEQALLKLVDNAVKYAAAGGELLIELKALDNTCLISVMDRGPGVPALHWEKIFEKFHRVDDSLTAGKPGSGLGLTIARSLRGINGNLTYETRQGGGSCFTIHLQKRG